MIRLVLMVLLHVAAAQDNKPTLSLPDANSCASRPRNVRFGNHYYVTSWDDGNARPMTWFHARNYCRKFCMDLVSIGSSAENDFVKQHVARGGAKLTWTSGRKCNFNDDCKAPHLQPVNIRGWFWATTKERMLPTDQQTPLGGRGLINDWSHTGANGQRQPDNYEQRVHGGADEACLAMGNNVFNDGMHWHDIGCFYEKPFMCEDSKELIDFTQFNNRHLRINN